MSKTSDQNQPLRILAVMAHPHDLTHCMGTCGIHAAEGDAVSMASLTNGATKHNEALYDELMKPKEEQDPGIVNMDARDYVRQKEQELRRACGHFGIGDVRIYAFPEPFRLAKSPEAVDAMRDLILDTRPDILITQSPYLDGNLQGRHGMATGAPNDHTQAAFAVLEGVNLAQIPDAATKRRPHRIAAVLYSGVYFMPDEVDFYVDISGWAEKRVLAEAEFLSQGHTPDFAKRRVELDTGRQGWMPQTRTAHAEGFVRAYRELLPRLSVSPLDLRGAREAKREWIQRVS